MKQDGNEAPIGITLLRLNVPTEDTRKYTLQKFMLVGSAS
jgi:hypothetical protein